MLASQPKGGGQVASPTAHSCDHPAVAEWAAVAVQPGGEGADRLVVLAVLREPRPRDELRRELGRQLADQLNPLYKVHDGVVAESLPRTASNKLMRRSLRAEYLRAHP